MALDCLLLPTAGVDLKRVDKMVSGSDRAGLDEESLHYHEFARALSEYRQDHFAQAIEWALLSVKDVRPAVQGMSAAVLTMANAATRANAREQGRLHERKRSDAARIHVAGN